MAFPVVRRMLLFDVISPESSFGLVVRSAIQEGDVWRLGRLDETKNIVYDVKHNPGSIVTDDSVLMRLDGEQAEALMLALHKEGVKLPERQSIVGALDAQSLHLADMRKLVFEMFAGVSKKDKKRLATVFLEDMREEAK
jgi:hypothetical protein